MNSIIFDKDKGKGNEPLLNKPSRFDMAINFYAVVKNNNNYKLVTYFYNPIWSLYYPFYDDVNKSPILKNCNATTFKELIYETDNIISINEEEKVKLAIKRFEELVGCKCKIIKSPVNQILYELKYSKTSNKYSIYKLYNYIIRNVDDVNKFLNPSNIQCKLYDIDNLNQNEIVSNAIYFVNSTKEILKEYALELI